MIRLGRGSSFYCAHPSRGRRAAAEGKGDQRAIPLVTIFAIIGFCLGLAAEIALLAHSGAVPHSSQYAAWVSRARAMAASAFTLPSPTAGAVSSASARRIASTERAEASRS